MNRYHIALLGDSIFDNAAYVPNGPAVIDHLRRILLADGRATLLARDGDVVADIADQLTDLPQDVSHLVLSVGGNDALAVADVDSFPAGTVNDALRHLTRIRLDFLSGYRKMLRRLIDLELPLAVCTVYEAIPGLTAKLQTALCVFNDSIIRRPLRHACRSSICGTSAPSLEIIPRYPRSSHPGRAVGKLHSPFGTGLQILIRTDPQRDTAASRGMAQRTIFLYSPGITNKNAVSFGETGKAYPGSNDWTRQ